MPETRTPITHDETLRSWRVGALTVTDSRYAPNITVARHAHRSADITLILAGGLQTGCRGVELVCRPHDVLFLPGGWEHADRFAPSGARTLIIELPDHG